MWVCEKCGAIKADQNERCMVCSLSGDVAETRPISPAAAGRYKMPPFLDDSPSPQVGMPRRFGIGTLMVLTTFFALLFGILKACRVPPIAFIAISVFIAGVAACQALLYGGRNPRKASFVGGAVMFVSAALLTAVVEGVRRGAVIPLIEGVLCNLVGAAILGGSLGYVAGCLVAGVFLVRKEPDDTEPSPEEPAEHRS